MPLVLDFQFAFGEDIEDSGVSEINNICPPKYTWNSENQQTYNNQLRLNLERISNDFHNSITNHNYELPLQLFLEAVYNAAEIMKKRVSDRKPDNNYTRKNKSWFDSDCKTLRRNSIRALRNFRIAKTHDALDTYKHIKADYKAMIKVKKDLYFEHKSDLLSDTANDKNPKAFWNLLKAERKPPKFGYKAG